MKNILFFFAILLAAHTTSQAQTADAMTSKFRVSGNCGMCKERIEKAAGKVKGVSFADWNEDTKLLTIQFDPAKTQPSKVHKAVAAVGHDTELAKAKDKVYNRLPNCCKYRE